MLSYIILTILSYMYRQFFYVVYDSLDSKSYTVGPGSVAIGLPGMSLDIIGGVVPLLLTLAVFFWAGRMAVQRVGQASAGVDGALRTFLWLLLAMLLTFISDIVLSLISGGYRIIYYSIIYTTLS
ncbi:MAG: hypothetical protein J2P37_19390 [Ktedonobacteraceae bacterium]|nr:hypothetical protein [Ktedonobacteraceae bacterium]